MKLLLDIHIEANGASVQFRGNGCEVLMIPFRGTAEGPVFTGVVEPCGVDTQVVNAAGVRHMSARYMLSGTDADGNPAHIYVENNGYFDDLHKSMPFRTVPSFYTDSPALEPVLSGRQLLGEGTNEADGLHIRFYSLADSESETGSGEANL